MTTLVQPPRGPGPSPSTAQTLTHARERVADDRDTGPALPGTRTHARERVADDRDTGPALPGTRRAAVVQVLVDGDRPERIAAAFELVRATRAGAVRVRAGADGPRRDPYRLADRLPTVDADAVVVVAPRRRGARRLAPGPTVAGIPVAIVQTDRPSDLPRTLAPPDSHAPWVMAAMAKNVFLDATEHWAATLSSGGRHVVDLRADRARRDDLVAAFRAGPPVVLYAGHGRARGWAGYQALRLPHLVPDDRPADGTPSRAAGLVMAFACGTLGRGHGRWPFGAGLVDAGTARAYLGPASSVRTDDARALADIVVDLLAATRPTTVAHLAAAIDRATTEVAPARRAWRTFRLVGRPDTPMG